MLTSRLLYLLPLGVVLIGWIVFGAIFLFQNRRSGVRTKKIDRASIGGICWQAVAFASVWSFGRARFSAILPLGHWFEIVMAGIVIALIAGSLWITAAARRALGKQWSLQARVLQSHALIRRGPYRFVRHPIYTGMLGMLIATGLAQSHWVGLTAGLFAFALGTLIRVRSEETLLREQFGNEYAHYAAEVPALLPKALAAITRWLTAGRAIVTRPPLGKLVRAEDRWPTRVRSPHCGADSLHQ